MEIYNKTIPHLPKNEKIKDLNIVFRGDIFRGNYKEQRLCLESIKYQLERENIFPNFDLKVTLCTYKHPLDALFLRMIRNIFGEIKIHDHRVEANTRENQENNFHYSLVHADKEKSNTLILRSDVCFISNFGLENFNENQFLFQWNYFHNYKLKEIPDQYHYVGKNQLSLVTEIIGQNVGRLGILPNGVGEGSLHNLYNILNQSDFDSRNISYMKEYLLDSSMFDGERCLLRGHSDFSLGDNPYVYQRTTNRKVLFVKHLLVRWYGWLITKFRGKL